MNNTFQIDRGVFKEPELKDIQKQFNETKKYTVFYYHRSFRATQIICDKKNLKFLTNLNEDTYESISKCLVIQKLLMDCKLGGGGL